jgi:alpha-ketoglutarate-dependent taurine dioxygenase
MSIAFEPIKSGIGARVIADKATLLGGEHAEEIRNQLEAHGVLVFKEIHFEDEEQVAFTETLGTFAPEHDGELVHKITLDVNTNPSADYLKGSMYWHLDGTMNKVPILASILCSKVLSDEGGETHFCNTYAAYDALSDEDKATYDELRVMHSAWASLFTYDPQPNIRLLEGMMSVGDNELPLVWRHRSGRKSLVLGCTAYEVVGYRAKESTSLLHKLLNHSTQDQFVYEHRWDVGDMVMWDNTGTLHRATPYDPKSGRCLHRTKLQGEEPFE